MIVMRCIGIEPSTPGPGITAYHSYREHNKAKILTHTTQPLLYKIRHKSTRDKIKVWKTQETKYLCLPQLLSWLLCSCCVLCQPDLVVCRV
jgi:hypothetical protein